MAVFCVFFAVFSYSFSASTSYRTAVIERKTYTFHEPSNMLVFLQINNSLLLGAICFLLLSLRGAYHSTLLCQKQNILVYFVRRMKKHRNFAEINSWEKERFGTP